MEAIREKANLIGVVLMSVINAAAGLGFVIGLLMAPRD